MLEHRPGVFPFGFIRTFTQFTFLALVVFFFAEGFQSVPAQEMAQMSTVTASKTDSESFFRFSQWNEAVQMAQETQRPLLVHFYPPTCPPCRRMESEVFSQAAVRENANRHYVTVKIDGKAEAALSQAFQIQAFPCDFILLPNKQVVAMRQGFQDPLAYQQFLTDTALAYGVAAPAVPRASDQNVRILSEAVAQNSREATKATQANQTTAVQSDSLADVQLPGLSEDETEAVAAKQVSFEQRTASANAVLPASASLPTASQALASAAAHSDAEKTRKAQDPTAEAKEQLERAILADIAPLESLPDLEADLAKEPLMLDGFCPVILVEKKRWEPGNAELKETYQGACYHFSSAEARDRFRADPEHYKVAFQGLDIVAYQDTHAQVSGTRRFGVRYGNLNFVFSSQENRLKFREDPEKYRKMVPYIEQSSLASPTSVH